MITLLRNTSPNEYKQNLSSRYIHRRNDFPEISKNYILARYRFENNYGWTIKIIGTLKHDDKRFWHLNNQLGRPI